MRRSSARTRFSRLLPAVVLVFTPAAKGTIVGLNQIVTPEIQPAGVCAVSAQVQHTLIGNSQQIQFELGLTPRFEVAWFQGLDPSEGFLSAEFNLLTSGPHLLTLGAINWSTRGSPAQPVLEYGYYTDKDRFVIGALRDAGGSTRLLLGYKRMWSELVQFSADFESGPTNSTTLGLTYNFTPALSVNPAVYWTNSHPHHLLGYVVFTWNLTVWK